jgi:hypothetical protein
LNAAKQTGNASLARSMFYLVWPGQLLGIVQSSLAIVDASLPSRLGLDYLAVITVIYTFYMLMHLGVRLRISKNHLNKIFLINIFRIVPSGK